MKSPITQNLIAPCGMNCGICRGYLRDNNPCPGCKYIQENKPVTRVKCRLRICTKRTGEFCCYCSEFPCERLKNLDRRYRMKYGMSEIENLEFIREYGIRKFVAREREIWISEKGVFCVHDKQYYR
jgi:hypothetical protein